MYESDLRAGAGTIRRICVGNDAIILSAVRSVTLVGLYLHFEKSGKSYCQLKIRICDSRKAVATCFFLLSR